ncbi:hypothetical protein C8F01DRAFT_1114069 [Mycena amicta]|nr:hypothetical protein C8F01DRAFT_1114069 [Mycena amicta]
MDTDSDLPLDLPNPTGTDDELEEEEESDQLGSDSMEDPVERIPGESLLPSGRLENIVKAHGVLGSLALSREGLYILSVATEEFIQRLAQGGYRQASAERRPCINYRDMAATTQQYQEFMFLRETIPSPVSVKDAMDLRAAKQRDMIANDPALLESTNHLTMNGTTSGKSKAKSKANGKDKAGKNASGSVRSKSPHGQVRWDYQDMPTASNGHTAPADVSSTSTRGGRGDAGWSRWAGANGPTFFPTDPRLNGLLANANAHTLASLNGLRAGNPLASTSSLLSNPYQRTTSLWSNASTPSTQATPAPDPTPDFERAPGTSDSTLVDNPGRTIYSEPKPPPTA